MLTDAQFEELVGEALDDLPPFFQAQMSNIVVLVEKWPSPRLLREMAVPPGETLLGLYRGVPLTARTHAYNLCLLYTSPSPRDRTRSRMPSSA